MTIFESQIDPERKLGLNTPKIGERDCPVGLSRIRMRIVKSSAAMPAFLFGGVAMAAGSTKLGKWAEQQQDASAMMGRASFTGQGTFTMGAICIQTVPPATIEPASNVAE